MGKYAVGVDVDGTFTDVVLGDGTNFWKTKVYTQPEKLARAFWRAWKTLHGAWANL